MSTDQDRSSKVPGLSVPDALVEEIRIELRRTALQARSAAARIHGGGGFRARRSQKLYQRFQVLSFVILVIAPLCYIFAYLWAMPAQYVTESRLSVVSQTNPTSGILSSLIGREDSGESYLIGYIESSNIIGSLAKEDPYLLEESGVLRENIVLAAVARSAPSLERKLELWKQHVTIDRQSFTSTIEISVAALTAESSLKLHEKILSLAEQHINLVSERQRTTQVSEATTALRTAQINLRSAVGRLQKLRQKYNMIDPELEATQRTSLIYQLEQQQAEHKQRLDVLQRSGGENPKIAQLANQIEALESQKQALRQSIAGTVEGTEATVAEAASDMVLLETDVHIARNEIAQRMFELSEARQNANRQGIFLQRSVSPVLPQTPHKVPKILYGLMFLGISVAIWLVIVGMGALIRDHAR